MRYKLEIVPRLYSRSFRWIEFNIWKLKEENIYVMKIHTKLSLTLHTWKICLKGFPGSMYVNWNQV
jgi:hypothetical protein